MPPVTRTLAMSVSGPPRRWWGLPQLHAMRMDYLGFVQQQREHGDLARMQILNEDVWDLMSPELVREALVTHADSLVRWERGIDVFGQLFGQSVLVTEGDIWQRQRRMLMPAFSPRCIAGYVQLMTDAAHRAFDAAVPAGQADALVCIGQHFAMLEMTLLAAQLLQRYKMVLPAGAAPCAPKLNVTLRPNGPVMLQLHRH